MKSEPKIKLTNSRKRSVVKKKTADLRTLAQQTEQQLNIIQRSMRQRLQAEFARGNLTGPQRLVMSVVVRTQGLSLKQLSEAVSLAHSTVSGIVDRLVQQGLIERQPHPTDRRKILIALSQDGRDRLNDDRRRRVSWLAEAITDRLNSREQRILANTLSLLDRLIEA